MSSSALPWIAGLAPAAPMLAFVLLAVPMALGRTPGEPFIRRVVALAFSLSLLASLVAIGAMSGLGETEIRVPLGQWFRVSDYGFGLTLVFDRLSAPFAAFGAGLVGLVGAFSARYLHAEPGFARFYLLLTLLGVGVQVVVLSGSLDIVYLGWELVGLSSALLIAFFHERPLPVRHGLRAFVTYRVCDVGLLAAAVWLHHSAGDASVGAATGGPWAGFVVPADVVDATIVGLLLVWATLGKSAQIPLGGWLPRAMEGPTPSSAIFYGALSIHLGPYLLLRAAPLLDASPVVAWTVVAIGGATALHATFVGRVQTDIKSALAYASMTQVGVILVEIGLGFRFLAVAHIVGHACIRALQILRSPSLLHDHHRLEQAMGKHLPRTGGHFERLVPRRLQPWLYRHALERGYFDALLQDYVVGRFVRLFRGVDALEERWVETLGGGALEPRDALAEGTEPAR